jgi:hypothetical protein
MSTLTVVDTYVTTYICLTHPCNSHPGDLAVRYLEYKDEANYTVSPADLLHHPRLPSKGSTKTIKAGSKLKSNKGRKARKGEALMKSGVHVAMAKKGVGAAALGDTVQTSWGAARVAEIYPDGISYPGHHIYIEPL